MKYRIHKSAAKSAYLQLYEQLREDIVNGIYPFGQKLPSKRLIADETGVSTVTAEHAYALLCDEGYLEARQRSGYFVIFKPGDGFAAPADSRSQLPSNTGYHTALQPEFPFSVLTKTMRRVMNEFGPAILERSPNAGCVLLRRAIQQYLARSRGILAQTEQIIIGAGSESLYSLIAELMGRGRTFALESPSYKKIEQVYKACGVRYEMLPLGHDGLESKALWETGATVLHISPYRSFPSGVTASASKRHEYMRWATEQDRYLIEDDFESEFSISKKPEETLFSHTPGDRVIYMNTFSKTVSPSFRTGYMVLPKQLLKTFEQNLGFYSCKVPTFVQLVLAQLLMNGDFERHINRVRRKKRRELLG